MAVDASQSRCAGHSYHSVQSSRVPLNFSGSLQQNFHTYSHTDDVACCSLFQLNLVQSIIFVPGGGGQSSFSTRFCQILQVNKWRQGNINQKVVKLQEVTTI